MIVIFVDKGLASHRIQACLASEHAESSLHLRSKGPQLIVLLKSLDLLFEVIDFLSKDLSIHFFTWILFRFRAALNLNSGEWLVFAKIIEVLLQILSLAWMTFKHNFSRFVNDHYVWYTFDTVLVARAALGFVVVLNKVPALIFNMGFDLSHGVIDGHANDSNLVLPSITFLLKHILVVSHRALAWTAPSSPKVNEPHLAFLVRKITGPILPEFLNRAHRLILISNTWHALDADLAIFPFHIFDDFLSFFRELFSNI